MATGHSGGAGAGEARPRGSNLGEDPTPSTCTSKLRLTERLYLSGESYLLVASVPGEVEMWNRRQPANTLDYLEHSWESQ